MIVYKLISPSGKIYIGVTSNTLEMRFSQHIAKSKSKYKNQSKLYRAFEKYPPVVWKKIVVYEGSNEECFNKEIELIKEYNSINNGYNTLPGGKISTTGIKKSWEVKEKHRQALKGRKRPAFTTAWKENMRKAHLGEKHTIERIEKNKVGHLGKPCPNKNKKISEEHRKNIIKSLIGNKRAKGYKQTKEHKQKISHSLLGKKQSREHVQKRIKSYLLKVGD